MNGRIPVLACLAVLLILITGKEGSVASDTKPPSRSAWIRDEPIKPIPLVVEVDPRKAALGEKLFHDRRLSRDNSLSCADCHSLERGGTDRRFRSVGITQTELPVNTPTVLNSGFNFRQFWDGRAATLEEQPEKPILAEDEMGSTWPEILRKLRESADYVSAFRNTYTNGLQVENITHAIAEFERTLTTPHSRFDRYLRGEDEAITAVELEGYRRFKSYGCIACHQGVNIGGNMFQRIGAVEDYLADRGNITKADLGRYNVTGNEEDKYVFKVPSLRNVELTPPYFHDGHPKTLEEAVALMARYQLGREMPEEDIQLIVAFLKTLTGELRIRK